jgi:hypothetical protein
MKLTIMLHYDLKAMFLTVKIEIGGEKSEEMHNEFLELKGWTDILSNYVGSRMGLTCFYEIKS